MDLDKNMLRDCVNMSGVEVKFSENLLSNPRLLTKLNNLIFYASPLHLLHMVQQQTKLSLPALLQAWWKMWPEQAVSLLMPKQGAKNVQGLGISRLRTSSY